MVKPIDKNKVITLFLFLFIGIGILVFIFVNQETVLSSLQNNFLKGKNYLELLKGLGNTLLITLVAFIFGLVLGLLVCFIEGISPQNTLSILLRKLTHIYVCIFRGTPTTVQLLIIYFVIFAFYNGNPLFIGMITFGLNSGAYTSEILRGGVEAVPIGQMEAGRSLGLSYKTVMRKIVFPQAVKNALPSLGNEFITLLKETSIVGFVGAVDLTLAFRKIANATYDYKTVYLTMGVVYFFIVLCITILLKRIERKFVSHVKG